MRYRVELDTLLDFIGRLEMFEQRAESLATRIDRQIADLHTTWSGGAAAAHRAQHVEWIVGATQMREALAELRTAAHNAHRHYTDAAQRNVEMLT
jgi:WXG100 family type VII secretion target